MAGYITNSLIYFQCLHLYTLLEIKGEFAYFTLFLISTPFKGIIFYNFYL